MSENDDSDIRVEYSKILTVSIQGAKVQHLLGAFTAFYELANKVGFNQEIMLPEQKRAYNDFFSVVAHEIKVSQ